MTRMGCKVKTVTRSEAFQRVLKRYECPNIMECGASVTMQFFIRLCKSPNYVNCHHFAKKMGELKSPVEWLQRVAVMEVREKFPITGEQRASVDFRRS
jgi:hypothetical protein